jgi:hypothetical protein
VTLHPTTFDYLLPTECQKEKMSLLRMAAKQYAEILDKALPEGPDKTYILRQHRSVAMWANVAITRLSNGAPRVDGDET